MSLLTTSGVGPDYMTGADLGRSLERVLRTSTNIQSVAPELL